MRLPKIDIQKEISNNIYYLMGAVDFSKYVENPDLYQTKSLGTNSRGIYKLLYRYAKEELSLDIANLKYRAEDGSLGSYEYDDDLIELSKATPGSKIITLVHETAHALIASGSPVKYNIRYEEIIVEASAYVVLLSLGLSITDVTYLKKKRTRAGTLEMYKDEITHISEQILTWVHAHQKEV